jgi:HEAT repeat protein
VDAYRNFLANHTGSTYYDDAIADLAEAESLVEAPEWSGEGASYGVAPPAHMLMEHDLRVRELERQLQELHWNRGYLEDDSSIDIGTLIRLDALNALQVEEDSEGSFQTLSEVVLERGNPIILRSQAIEILSRFGSGKSIPVLIQVARNDTDTVIQSMAIDYLSNAGTPETVGGLIEIFQSLPPGRPELSSKVFFSIAETGTDQAVDFLASVARTHENPGLRRVAVYYLGAIGSERSRSAIHIILRGK